MTEGLAVIAWRFLQTEVDAEASAESLDASCYAVLAEQALQARVELVGHREDVLVKTGAAIRLHRGQPGRNNYGVTIVGAAVLAIAVGHEFGHDVLATAEDAEGIAA